MLGDLIPDQEQLIKWGLELRSTYTLFEHIQLFEDRLIH